jgi:hypothetical protein
MTYSTDRNFAANLVSISPERAFEVINMNKAGQKPERLDTKVEESKEKKESHDILEESVTRFDHLKKKKKNNNGRNKQNSDQRKSVLREHGKRTSEYNDRVPGSSDNGLRPIQRKDNTNENRKG